MTCPSSPEIENIVNGNPPNLPNVIAQQHIVLQSLEFLSDDARLPVSCSSAPARILYCESLAPEKVTIQSAFFLLNTYIHI